MCDLSKNETYCKEIQLKNKLNKKIPIYIKMFSYQRIKRKIFLYKMDKIYKVKKYKYKKGGF